MKKLIPLAILLILALILLSGCTSKSTNSEQANSTPDSSGQFSEEVEKQICWDLVKLQDKYTSETMDEDCFPTDEYPEKQSQAYVEIAEKYDTTEEIVRNIGVRCASNNWPMPPTPPPCIPS